ncbi:DUF1039 domain-containing protein [Pandoraea nosoerga]|uniref:Type III secretion apparatus n=1 Tax=Pandoraea nosoerga TaxID=2508296 RepID=A0A5E4XGB8_9BURK|nr:DUF1039 domain-containing protein [Pandoraea nosoerga]MBN4668262.1 DUF1039 domain-containing protein [Pandoraea nosoerga]MBN4677753.1 DUF1039 domain-containing protein [Pandoraea nosoerga]MBN4682719.1 DUF1039 domain-containing protein [Pandoraea nosoerga]MBN4746585.1 DUF1039 domain-containing protein [Pandoraea nosoerga]VVE35316.1 type III secretion apparatus [Pandoraea nosoerga]
MKRVRGIGTTAPEPSLDAVTRQTVVELAFAGAQHGMHGEARTILDALPALVPERETREWLHAALLIALGDTQAARACLARFEAADGRLTPSVAVLARWLAEAAPAQVDANGSFVSSAAASVAASVAASAVSPAASPSSFSSSPLSPSSPLFFSPRSPS